MPAEGIPKGLKRNALTSQTSSGGVTEQPFTFGEIPGVLWTPDGVAEVRPLILMGHGGGQHKKAPGIVARARRFAAECGFAAVEFLVQWDDQWVPRAASLALFDLFASAEKTLHANPGKHGDLPVFELDSALRFFTRHLG